MIYATIFICGLVAAGPCKPIVNEQGYKDEAACFAAAWPIARDFVRRHPKTEVAGVGCAPKKEGH